MHTNLPQDFSGGLVNWRLRVLHYVAKALGLLVHVEGFPYGTRRCIKANQDDAPGFRYSEWQAAARSL